MSKVKRVDPGVPFFDNIAMIKKEKTKTEREEVTKITFTETQ